MLKFKNIIYKNSIVLIIAIFLIPFFVEASISCSVTTQSACSGITMLRMSASANAHAELPSQSNSAYDGNVVCCTGPSGLNNSCADANKETIVRMSGVTNAHVEKNTESGTNYIENACLSSSSPGDEITIAYQSTNCDTYDTTLFSMSNDTTNAQVGDSSAYANKVCATIFTQSLTFSISDNSIGFGTLSNTSLRYSSGDGGGSESEVESFYVEVTTNAPSGYSLYIRGNTLSNGPYIIDPIGGTNLTPTPGSNAFGLRAVATGGNGIVESPYDGSGFAYDADANNSSLLGSSSSGDEVTTNYSIRGIATIDDLLHYGNYSTNITYTVVPNF